MAEIKARGKDPSNLSPEEFREISLLVRDPAERIRAGLEASASWIKTRVFTVSLPVYWERRGTCEKNSCGMFITLKGDNPACLDCGCGGNLLEDVKWWDAGQECPRKLWLKDGSKST